MTEPELIEGILKRDRTAFQHLVDKYQVQIIKTACHFLGNMEDAEDLSQEIFIDIIHSMASFRQSASLSTWIYRITVNRALNALKKRQRAAVLLRLESLLKFSGSEIKGRDPEPAVLPSGPEQEEDRLILHDAIRHLPEKQRIAFVLNKFEERSYREVAEIMQLGLPAVESLIHRARLNLQKTLLPRFTQYQKQ